MKKLRWNNSISSFISVDLFITNSTTNSCKFSYKEKYEIVKKQLKEEKDPNIVFQAFCILEDNKGRYKIGSYKIVPKKWMIAYLLDWAHKSIKSHLKTRETGEYRIRGCQVPLCLVSLWIWKNLGLWKKFQQKILCKKLCLWTYYELDLLISVCFFLYLNTMK